MRLPRVSSPRLILILAFFVPLLSLVTISTFSTLSSSLLTNSRDDSLTSASTPSLNTTANPASLSYNRTAMITRPPTKSSATERDAGSLSKPSSPSPTTPYHIPGSHTTTPLATMLSTPFPGPRWTETWRRALALTHRASATPAHNMGTRIISTTDMFAAEHESRRSTEGMERRAATLIPDSWMARVRRWWGGDRGGQVDSVVEWEREAAERVFEMTDEVMVVMVLRARNETEETIGSEDGEGMALVRESKQYSYKYVTWGGRGDLITLFSVCMTSIGMLRLLGKTI